MPRLPFRRPMGRIGAIAALRASAVRLAVSSLTPMILVIPAGSDARGALATTGGVQRLFEF